MPNYMYATKKYYDRRYCHYDGSYETLLQQCGQHGKDDYPNWTRNTMGINKQGYEAKMNDHHQNQMQKGKFCLAYE